MFVALEASSCTRLVEEDQLRAKVISQFYNYP